MQRLTKYALLIKAILKKTHSVSERVVILEMVSLFFIKSIINLTSLMYF